MRFKKTAIPLRIDPRASVVVIDASFKGRWDFRFLKMVLDTGASVTTIPAEAALAIGCDPSKPLKRIEMITASGTEYVPVVKIPKMRFLGFEVEDVEMACLDLPLKALVSGLLGLNVLKKFDIRLGFRSRIFEITG